jgi:hypothetical protein
MTCIYRALGTVSLLASFALGGAAFAQSHSMSRAETVTQSVTVQSVDAATRHMVIKRPSGELVSVKVPTEVRNFGQLRPGDSITATYSRETEIAILPPGKAPPKDTAAVVTAHATEGQMPAGIAATRIVVTGAVLGIDQQTHRMKVVSPKGGAVHEFSVDDPQGREMMRKVKVGDKITAEIHEAMLISANRN